MNIYFMGMTLPFDYVAELFDLTILVGFASIKIL